MLRIELSIAAEDDLTEIWTHIAIDNRQAADSVFDLIDRRFQSIARFPKIGAAYPKIGDGLRCLWAGNYGIFYRVKSDAAEIVRILHGDARHTGGVSEVNFLRASQKMMRLAVIIVVSAT